jgi:hypothetical protein
MPAEEVLKRLEDRRRLGRELERAGGYADQFLGALSKWSATTVTALDNLFIGSKTSTRFHETGRVGSGIPYESVDERLEDAVERHQRRLDDLESIIDGLSYMHEAAGGTQPASRSRQSGEDRSLTINVQSGNVNLGTVVGDVTSNVSGLTGRDAEDIKALMGRLARAVVDAELRPDTKAEAVEAVEVVSESLKAGGVNKPSAILRSAIRRIPVLLETADQALKVWNELQGLLGPHLPPGTL